MNKLFQFKHKQENIILALHYGTKDLYILHNVQGLNYSIYIIEQNGTETEPFNRAKLFNVGVIEGIFNQEMRRHHQYLGVKEYCFCVILHDVDMLPVSTKL